jgi:betaine reductase
MESKAVRAFHYLNQFFGGIGGEEKADVGPEIKEGPVGPGLGLQKAFGDRGQIVATVICGDNHFSSHISEVRQFVLEAVRKHKPDVVIAGPAFNAGRYGVACGEVCKAVAETLGIAAVTAMYSENPAVETYRQVDNLWILPTSERALDMPKILERLAEFALKVGRGAEIGPAREEGYIPTGRRKLGLASASGVERAVNMMLAKLAGLEFQTEIPIERFDPCPPAPPVKDLKAIRLGLITTSGLVPKGNPDGFRMFNATKWSKYLLPNDWVLRSEDWEVIHGGFNTAYAQTNPNLVLPLDVLREMIPERIGALDDYFYSITGVGTSLAMAKRAGMEIAASMRKAQLGAVLLVAT